MSQSYGAYVDQQLRLEPTGEGILSRLTFAIKDVFSIAGVINSAGNPDWLRTHTPSTKHAVVVSSLLDQGATLSGTTITDELMYSINGENFHYGTPQNPNAPGRIPGGSSSGSAVVAAAKLADFTIGTDTGGSVRVPSSYCGIYGIRPTHGLIDTTGLIPLAPSFDTVGWMSSSIETMCKVGQALLPQQAETLLNSPSFTRILIADDMWELADEATNSLREQFINQLPSHIHIEHIQLCEEGLTDWMDTFRLAQGLEIWEAHGEWITENKPSFGPGISDRFAWASSLDRSNREAAFSRKAEITSYLTSLLPIDTLILAPITPSVAPLELEQGELVELRRGQTLRLSCVAGLGGLPQVTIPKKGIDGLPVAVSLIAGKDQDLRLLRFIKECLE